MLIFSPRHGRSDLALWKDYEEADLLVTSVDRMVEQSLKEIERFVCACSGSVYAGVSWGKDSVVLAHLLWRRARDVTLVHLRPTNHNPDCDAVRDVYRKKFYGQPYEEVLVDYSRVDRAKLPDCEVDKATDRMWYAAIRDVDLRYGGKHLLGIRKDESAGRRIRMCKWGLSSPNACAPIGYWHCEHVFAYLAQQHLPVHPAYAMLGGGRWRRDRIRVAELGDTHGRGGGRLEWENEYYGEELRRWEQNRESGK